MYSLGTWFVSGIYVWIPCIKKKMIMMIMMIIINNKSEKFTRNVTGKGTCDILSAHSNNETHHATNINWTAPRVPNVSLPRHRATSLALPPAFDFFNCIWQH
jgi:hypothetical protein